MIGIRLQLRLLIFKRNIDGVEIQKYYGRTDGPTDTLTWVGARDTCISKNCKLNTNEEFSLMFSSLYIQPVPFVIFQMTNGALEISVTSNFSFSLRMENSH